MRRTARLTLLVLSPILFLVSSPIPGTATKCDCKPEFEVHAEAEGICEVTRDDRRWCEIRFNSSTGSGPRQREFLGAIERLSVKIVDNVKAAQRLNAVPPEQWDKTFIDEDMVSLLAVALWERAPDKIKPISDLVRENSGKILPAMKMHPNESHQFIVERYMITASRGCLDIDDKTFGVMIKTRFSEAINRCTAKR